ncbi:MAG: error-prone DNA polymerase, partial [Planctomycetes bacterium]|nr:error-prone DNA polymerase [Planctomycetota bacterium]
MVSEAWHIPGGEGRYAELAVTSNCTFLTGASHPEEFVARAQELGHVAASVCDLHTLCGVVRAHVAAKGLGMPLAVGARVRAGGAPPGEEPAGGGSENGTVEMLLFAGSRGAYSGLCRLLTLGKRRVPKGECHLTLHDVLDRQAGLLAVVMPPARLDDGFARTLLGLRGVFDEDRLSLGLRRDFGPDDATRLWQVATLGKRVGVSTLAVNDALYHAPERRALQDVVTCVRLGCTVERAGHRLAAHAERHLKPAVEMRRLFAGYEHAVERAAETALRAAAFSMDEVKYEYPVDCCPRGVEPAAHLAALTWAGARGRYPGGVPEKVRGALEHELALIRELRYEAYFLTCHDLVSFARSRGIVCQGRGGAANSAVCYCLGLTEVDPARFNLLFERFISRARNEPPDIDIDFEHERREEVIQYLYEKYGRDRAALTAVMVTYRGRSAVRDVGKAMGLPADTVDAMAKGLDVWSGRPKGERVREAGVNPDEPLVRKVLELSSELVGFPRHLSQHVGGFVITRETLDGLVPVENAAMEGRTVIEWDKDDLDAMGILKIDVLGLGMLSCVSRTLEMLGAERGVSGQGGSVRALRELLAAPQEEAVYDMICRADTLGVFQIESRAQMSMLPRLRPREFYDLVIEVAIVRPGPIQGKMVHPYLRRRNGEEAVTYPSEEVRGVLGRTLGVPLFQEQAMQLAITAAGFTPDEADALRRSMAAWRRKGDLIYRFGAKLIEGMTARGYSREFAERCFEQIKGFSEYGFPESHAASFALIVYASCYLKRRHPAAFAAALINSQPMGFYAPAQIVRDAKEHGVEVLGVDVNRSAWDCTLEGADARTRAGDGTAPAAWGQSGPSLRLGMRLVKGMSEREAGMIRAAVERHGVFKSVLGLARASGVGTGTLRRLARADAFGSMGLSRQSALWAVRAMKDDEALLFEHALREGG